ncbi:MAG: 5'/3'-nucleotidase SurE [Lachnospiraceae bacterium]|nr:5'/3'-nucleotidase SurE [Lachnospiraceae bacterium]
MRKILITNDDGIDAHGIKDLARAALKYGDVWVIAPDGQRSAASHSITLRESMYVYEDKDFGVEGVKAFKTTASPADCVRFGIRNFVKDVDVVFSGINNGYNIGSDIQYSATVGAAMEAATSKIRAIAFSQSFDGDGYQEVTDKYLDQIIGELIDAPLEDNQIWNVNFPNVRLSDFKGILRDRSVARNSFYIDSYKEEKLEDGGLKLTVWGDRNELTSEGTDFKALLDGYISIGRVNNLR